MIPAILSCVFVLYLYRMLNEPESSGTEEVSGDSLSAKLENLQARLDSIHAAKNVANVHGTDNAKESS